MKAERVSLVIAAIHDENLRSFVRATGSIPTYDKLPIDQSIKSLVYKIPMLSPKANRVNISRVLLQLKLCNSK